MATFDWILVSFIAAVHLATSARVAIGARRLGLSAYKWLVVCLLFSAIPAIVYFYRFMRRQRQSMISTSAASGVSRCLRCGSLLDIPETPGPVKLCPNCRLPLDQRNLA